MEHSIFNLRSAMDIKIAELKKNNDNKFELQNKSLKEDLQKEIIQFEKEYSTKFEKELINKKKELIGIQKNLLNKLKFN
jgi:hypothetical protein